MLKWVSFLLILASGCAYQVMAEKVNPEVNPFASLIITYGSALLIALVLFLLTKNGQSVSGELKKVNIFSVILGCVICFYELGFVLAYRYGWGVGNLSPIVSVATMLVLAVIAVILYHDKLTAANIIGLLIAAVGVLLTIK